MIIMIIYDSINPKKRIKNISKSTLYPLRTTRPYLCDCDAVCLGATLCHLLCNNTPNVRLFDSKWAALTLSLTLSSTSWSTKLNICSARLFTCCWRYHTSHKIWPMEFQLLQMICYCSLLFQIYKMISK